MHNADAQQIIIIAGWECQDLSPAGSLKGLRGSKSSTFYQLVQILQWFQEYAVIPPAYVIENTAMQFNFRSKDIRQKVFPEICQVLGEPVVLDAAQFGSYAHRLRNFWTNLADTQLLQLVARHITRDPAFVNDILDPGRVAQPALRTDTPPFYPCNVKGQPLQALPTLMAAHDSYAFRNGGQGQIYDNNTQSWTQPNPCERERALGYDTASTAAPALDDKDRHVITGRAIDANTVEHLFLMSSELHNIAHHLPGYTAAVTHTSSCSSMGGGETLQ